MDIQVQNISKKFGDTIVLDNVSLDIKSGELVALLGPSGSGKTTLLRIISGMELPDSGAVRIGGKEITLSNRSEKRKVGFVFQHYALFKHMTVFDNIAFGLRVRPKKERLSDFEIRRKVMKLLKLVHLKTFHRHYPSQLSGGQRQRVALARALAVEPEILLLDEPFGALDAKVRKQLRRWMRRLHNDINITSIFVTHDQEEAMEVSDRVVVMSNGKIEQVGTPGDVYNNPANAFVYDFLGNYNVFEGWKDETGKEYLLESDPFEEEAEGSPEYRVKRRNWISRYPEISGLLIKIIPGLAPDTSSFIPQTKKDLSGSQIVSGKPVKFFARPHELYITKNPEEGEYVKAQIIHLNYAGSLVKIEMERLNGDGLTAEVPKEVLERLDIKKSDFIYVRPKSTTVFDD